MKLSENIQQSYDNGVTDEFIKPIVHIDKNGHPVGKIQEEDAVICFNFRTDRCREITTVLTQTNMTDFEMQKLKLHYKKRLNFLKVKNNIPIETETRIPGLDIPKPKKPPAELNVTPY